MSVSLVDTEFRIGVKLLPLKILRRLQNGLQNCDQKCAKFDWVVRRYCAC